jgi:hypothetical protein
MGQSATSGFRHLATYRDEANARIALIKPRRSISPAAQHDTSLVGAAPARLSLYRAHYSISRDGNRAEKNQCKLALLLVGSDLR